MAKRELLGDRSRVRGCTETERKEEEYRKEKRMKTRYGDTRKADKGVPSACDCGAAVMVTNTHGQTSRGEQYLSCPYDISDVRGQGCGFRRGWIEACQDEFVNIRDEKNELKKELAAANKRIEDHEASIFALELQLDDLTKESKKEAVPNPGEHLDTSMGLVNLMERFDAQEKKYIELEKRYDALEKKYRMVKRSGDGDTGSDEGFPSDEDGDGDDESDGGFPSDSDGSFSM